MSRDRHVLAGQLDTVVVGLRRLASDHTDLSLTGASTLATLGRSGPTRVTELADSEGVSQPSMTALVTRLAARGLVSRSGDPADGRVVLVSLTVDGVDLLERRRETRTARLAGPLGRLADDDVDRIAAALPALARLTAPPPP